MSIIEIENPNYTEPHMVWEIKIPGISNSILHMERYGNFCLWNTIKIKKNSDEVYRITLTHKDDKEIEELQSKSVEERRKFFKKLLSRKSYKDKGEIKDTKDRTEFFFGDFFRKYTGNQFSFIEYVEMTAQREKLLKAQEYTKPGLFGLAALDPKIEKKYRKNLQKILSEKS